MFIISFQYKQYNIDIQCYITDKMKEIIAKLYEKLQT